MDIDYKKKYLKYKKKYLELQNLIERQNLIEQTGSGPKPTPAPKTLDDILKEYGFTKTALLQLHEYMSDDIFQDAINLINKKYATALDLQIDLLKIMSSKFIIIIKAFTISFTNKNSRFTFPLPHITAVLSFLIFAS